MAATNKAAKAAADEPTPEGAVAEPVQEQSATEPETSGGNNLDNLINEVLGGRYGDHNAARQRLTDEGHDATAVLAGVNRRIAGGAPHAYQVSGVHLLEQVRDGEWGEDKGLRQRLTAAGFSKPDVDKVLNQLDKE